MGLRVDTGQLLLLLLLLQGVGAVASRRAAELYGLEIIDENINDNKDNVTRFIKLARWGQLFCASVLCVACLRALYLADTRMCGERAGWRLLSVVLLTGSHPPVMFAPGSLC